MNVKRSSSPTGASRLGQRVGVRGGELAAARAQLVELGEREHVARAATSAIFARCSSSSTSTPTASECSST